jgi:hypothetical protein
MSPITNKLEKRQSTTLNPKMESNQQKEAFSTTPTLAEGVSIAQQDLLLK